MKHKRWALFGLIGYLVLLLVLMVTDWRPSLSTNQKPIRVVASLNFYGEAAKEVAGKYGQVTNFINSAATDPHDYQPTTKQAKQLASANVAIENGLGYDAWMSDMIKADKHSIHTVNVGTQVANKKSGQNEHVWYQPQTMVKLTNYLAKTYSTIDPDHKTYYHRRAARYQKQLAELNQLIKQAKANVPANAKVAVSEPVFDYALKNLGYTIVDQHFEKAIEDGNDPSPADIANLQSAIKNKEIAFFVNNSQASDTTVKNLVKLAKQSGVPVLNVTETKPDNKTYVEWMKDQYRALIKIQKEAQ